MKMPNASVRYGVLFACLAVVGTAASTGFAPALMSDSYEYINFAAVRPALYPWFIAAFGGNLSLVVYAQCALYAATLFWLICTLHTRFNSHLITAGFGLAMSCNPFVWSYHAMIMTESLAFSGINVLLVSLLNMLDRKRSDYLLWVCLSGISIGALTGLRPAMWGFAPALGLVVVFTGFRSRVALPAIACLVIFMASSMAAERIGYYVKHDERSSLLSNFAFGRAAMLTTKSGFVMPELSPYQRNALEQTVLFMEPIGDYLQNDDVSPLLKHSMLSTLETFAQGRVWPHLVDNGLIPPPPPR